MRNFDATNNKVQIQRMSNISSIFSFIIISAISQLNSEDFFLNNWEKYFPKVLPIPVPNSCRGEKIPLDSADESLANVVSQGILRVGIHQQLAGYPSFYSALTEYNETVVDTKSNKSGTNWTLDLNEETLEGYEIDAARAATKRLGELYNVELDTKFVIIKGTDFFKDLRDALNFEIIDVFWSYVFKTDERSKEVDFICNTYMTDYYIVGTDKVSSERPDPNGPVVDVVCFGYACTFAPPPPFQLIKLQNSTVNNPIEVLLNTTDPYEYGVTNFDRIQMFINERCPTCQYIDVEAIGTVFVNPATKFVAKTIAVPTVDTSGTTLARFYVQAWIMIVFTSISLVFM